jgi:hypothetical protein
MGDHSVPDDQDLDRQRQSMLWRKRAAAFRIMANATHDANNRGSLRRQAEQWDTMAARAESLAPANHETNSNSILRTFIALMRSDFGNVQLLNRQAGKLSIVSHHGFTKGFLDDFTSVDADSGCACGRALRSACGVFVPDVEVDTEYAPFRSAALAAGYRAVISVPIRAMDRGVIGIISAHYRVPQRASMSRIVTAQAFGAAAGEAWVASGDMTAC